METVQRTVTLPKASDTLADSLKKLVLAVIANHKTATSAPMEIGTDVAEAVQLLGPALGGVGALGDEGKADVVGLAEAFAIAGMELGRELKAQADAAVPAAPAEAAPAAPAAPSV